MGLSAASQGTTGDRKHQVGERRLNMRLMSYWLELRGKGSEALAERFDPKALQELWPHCFTIIDPDRPERAKLDRIGEAIAMESGLAPRAMAASKVPTDTLLGHALRLADEVMRIKYPIVDSGEFTDFHGRKCLYRSILLPLSNDRGEISLVVGGARSKALEPKP